MKRSTLILALLASILVLIIINGCGQASGTVCGDGVCDATESCLCGDCTSAPQCADETTNVKENCDDNNACTRDSFNTLTKQCEYEVLVNCCGNNKCDEGERCDQSTHTTVCREDCGIQCEGYIESHKSGGITSGADFECGDSNCQEDGANRFTIRSGSSSIITTVENIGERVSSPITSAFVCRRDGRRVVSNDGEIHSGVTFSDSFNGAEKVDLRGQYTGDNEIKYRFKLDISEIKLSDFDCTITIDSPQNTVQQIIYIAIRQ